VRGPSAAPALQVPAGEDVRPYGRLGGGPADGEAAAEEAAAVRGGAVYCSVQWESAGFYIEYATFVLETDALILCTGF
jgi:hypothetical protein